MTTQEILEKIKLLIDTDLTDAQLIGQMNELSKKLFRKFVLPESIYKFETTSIPYYELPADCSEDRIRCVVVDDQEYLKVSPEVQHPPAYFCTVLLGSLYVSCNITGKDAYLYYRPRPVMLSTLNLSEVPNFPEDFHDLYVYDGARFAAMPQRDTDLINAFQSEYNDIFEDAQKSLKKMGLKRAKETTIW